MSPAPAILHRLNAWIDARPPRSLRRLLFACVVLFVWSLDTHGNYAGTGDEPHYAMIAHSLVFDGDLDLSNDYADPSNLVGSGTLPPEAHAVPGIDGRLRPVHDIGLPVLAAPFFAVAYWITDRSSTWVPEDVMRRARLNPPLVLRHLLSLGMIVVAASMAVLVFDIGLSIARSQAQAFLWTLVFALSPPLLSHSFLFFTEIPSALLVTIVFRDLLKATPRSQPRALVLGLLVALLLLLHVRNIGLVCGFASWWLWTIRDKPDRLRLTLAFIAPLAAIAAIRTAVNYRFWGGLVSGPHAHLGSISTTSEMLSEMGVRTFGLLLDQEHGLLMYAPVYLLALPGLVIAWTANRRLGGAVLFLTAASCLPILLPMINPYGWAGGWSPAARFLVPIAPLLAIAAFVYRSSLATVPWTVTTIVTVQCVLDAIYWSRPKVLWNDGTGRGALAALASPLDLPAWLPSWHAPSSYATIVSLAVTAAWLALSMRASRRAMH
jgi:hypothetical protein